MLLSIGEGKGASGGSGWKEAVEAVEAVEARPIQCEKAVWKSLEILLRGRRGGPSIQHLLLPF